MLKNYTDEIPVTKLLLSVENPRFGIVDSQKEAIETMIESQNEKLYNLAKSILEDGLNPSDIPIVIPDSNNVGEYIVLDANRRITALKLLLPKIFKELIINV